MRVLAKTTLRARQEILRFAHEVRQELVSAEGSILEEVDLGENSRALEEWAGWEPPGGWQTPERLGAAEEARVARGTN